MARTMPMQEITRTVTTGSPLVTGFAEIRRDFAQLPLSV